MKYISTSLANSDTLIKKIDVKIKSLEKINRYIDALLEKKRANKGGNNAEL